MNNLQCRYEIGDGRVNLDLDNFNHLQTTKQFEMYEKIPIAGMKHPTQGLWMDTQLSKLFFSIDNIQIIQNAIRAGIYHATNKQHIIGNQDNDTLLVIMRSIYMENVKHNNDTLSIQIYQLNKMVIQYSVKQIHIELVSYMKYIKDISSMHVPIDHPIPVNNSKHKELEMKPFF